MTDDPKPYIFKKPNDLIRADDWNDLQVQAQKEIRKHTHEGGADGTQIDTAALKDGAVTYAKLNRAAKEEINGGMQSLVGDERKARETERAEFQRKIAELEAKLSAAQTQLTAAQTQLDALKTEMHESFTVGSGAPTLAVSKHGLQFRHDGIAHYSIVNQSGALIVKDTSNANVKDLMTVTGSIVDIAVDTTRAKTLRAKSLNVTEELQIGNWKFVATEGGQKLNLQLDGKDMATFDPTGSHVVKGALSLQALTISNSNTHPNRYLHLTPQELYFMWSGEAHFVIVNEAGGSPKMLAIRDISGDGNPRNGKLLPNGIFPKMP